MKLFTISAILEEKLIGNPQAATIKDPDLFNDFMETKKVLETTMKSENCVQMEGVQVYIYGVLREINEIFIVMCASADYFNLARKVRSLSNIIFALSNNCYLLLIDVLRERNGIEISKAGPFLRV